MFSYRAVGTDHNEYERSHHLPKDDIREGVHYKLLGIRDVCVVEMTQRGEQVSFKVLEE